MNPEDRQSQLSDMANKFNSIQQRIYEIQQSFGESTYQIKESTFPSESVELLDKLCDQCKQNIFKVNESINIEGSIQQLLDQNYYLLKQYYQSQAKSLQLEGALLDKDSEILNLRSQLKQAQTNLVACKTYIQNLNEIDKKKIQN